MRLERKGLVRRTPAAEDGRGAYAELSAEGAELFHEAAVHHIEFVRSTALRQFTEDELRTLADLLARMNDPGQDQTGPTPRPPPSSASPATPHARPGQRR